MPFNCTDVLTRRVAFGRLIRVGAGVVALPLLPSLTTEVGFRFPPTSQGEGLTLTASELNAAILLLRHRDQSDFFVARAALWGLVFELLGVVSAVFTILDFLDVHLNRKPVIDYENAGGCTDNFKACEYRYRGAGVRQFIGVERSPINKDIAVLAGLSPKTNGAMIGTQYGGMNLSHLAGPAPGLVCGTRQFLVNACKVPAAQAVNTAAVAAAGTERVNGQTLNVVRFANGGYVQHLPTPYGDYDGGTVQIHFPPYTEEGNLPILPVRLKP